MFGNKISRSRISYLEQKWRKSIAENWRKLYKAAFSLFVLLVAFAKKTGSYQCHGQIAQPAKLDLNKKSFPKQKTIQNFTIDAQGFRKTKNENPPTWEIEVTS